MTQEIKLRCRTKEKRIISNQRDHELIAKVKAGHFQDFQDLFAEVTSLYCDFFGIDPYPIWEAENGHKTN